jgi:hypothetical protein
MKMNIVRMAIGAMTVGCMTCHGQVVPKHRDLLVGVNIGSLAAIYVVESQTGQVRGLLSGQIPGSPVTTRGSGPVFSNEFIRLVTTRSGKIYASTASRTQRLLAVDAASGDRTALPISITGNGIAASALAQIDQRTLLLGSYASAFRPVRQSELYRVDLVTNAANRIFGELQGDGPVLETFTSIAVLNRDEAIVTEFRSGPDSLLYRVNLATGGRSVLSLIGSQAADRQVITAGVLSSAFVRFGPGGFGTGPNADASCYPAAVLDGSIYVAVNLQEDSTRFYSGVLGIHGASGDRDLRLGYALLDNSRVSAPAIPGLSIDFQFTTCVSPGLGHELLIGEGLFNTRLIAWSPESNEGRVITDLAPLFVPRASIRSVAIYTNCPADVNLDGIADDADFSPFAVAYSIGVCEDPAMPLPCPSDLNADGMVDDADFAIFMTGYDRLLCE